MCARSWIFLLKVLEQIPHWMTIRFLTGAGVLMSVITMSSFSFLTTGSDLMMGGVAGGVGGSTGEEGRGFVDGVDFLETVFLVAGLGV